MTKILYSIEIYTITNKLIIIPAKNIDWAKRPKFPSCFTIDIVQEIEIEEKGIQQVFFLFHKIPNISIDIWMEDRSTISARSIKASMLSTKGFNIFSEDLGMPMRNRYIFEFKQNTFSEEDEEKGCKNYPWKEYSSYRDCDDSFVSDQLGVYPFIPVWATDDLKVVTNHTFFDKGKDEDTFHLLIDLYDGTRMSSCPLPCTSTTVSGLWISSQNEAKSLTTFDFTFGHTIIITVSKFPRFNLARFVSNLGGSLGLWFGLGVSQLILMVSLMCPKLLRRK